MILAPYIFTILLSMPSFGGPVTVTFEATDKESCLKLHKLISKQAANMRLNGTIQDCKEK